MDPVARAVEVPKRMVRTHLQCSIAYKLARQTEELVHRSYCHLIIFVSSSFTFGHKVEFMNLAASGTGHSDFCFNLKLLRTLTGDSGDSLNGETTYHLAMGRRSVFRNFSSLKILH